MVPVFLRRWSLCWWTCSLFPFEDSNGSFSLGAVWHQLPMACSPPPRPHPTSWAWMPALPPTVKQPGNHFKAVPVPWAVKGGCKLRGSGWGVGSGEWPRSSPSALHCTWQREHRLLWSGVNEDILDTRDHGFFNHPQASAKEQLWKDGGIYCIRSWFPCRNSLLVFSNHSLEGTKHTKNIKKILQILVTRRIKKFLSQGDSGVWLFGPNPDSTTFQPFDFVQMI